LKFFQVLEESAKNYGGAIAAIGSADEIQTVERFCVQEAVQEERIGEMI
jgi:hypothetical protein